MFITLSTTRSFKKKKKSDKEFHYCLCNLRFIPDLMSVTLLDTVEAEIEHY